MFLEAKGVIGKTQLLCVYLTVIWPLRRVPSHTNRAHSVRDAVYHCQPFTTMYLRPSYMQTSCRDIVTVTWTLLTVVHAGMLLTHTPMHFFLLLLHTVPHQSKSPTGLEGLCHEFYSSSNAEQHWAQHIAVCTTTPHIIAELFKNVCHKPSSSYLCWHVERTCIFPGVLHSSLILRNTSIVMPSSLLQWALQQHSRPTFWKEQLKTFKQNGQSCVCE